MNRRLILADELHKAERDLAYTTHWLAQCDLPAYPGAGANRETFLDWRFDANDRYARALALAARLEPLPVVPTQPRLL